MRLYSRKIFGIVSVVTSILFFLAWPKPVFADNVQLSGTITDNHSIPVSGIQLGTTNAGGLVTTTDSNGFYSFSVPSGYNNLNLVGYAANTYIPVSSLDENWTINMDLNLSGDTTFNIQIPIDSVHIVVLDPSGAPAANVPVSLPFGPTNVWNAHIPINTSLGVMSAGVGGPWYHSSAPVFFGNTDSGGNLSGTVLDNGIYFIIINDSYHLPIFALRRITSDINITYTLNSPPTILGLRDVTLTLGSNYTANGTYTDINLPLGPQQTATVDYGDGSGVQPLFINFTNTYYTPDGVNYFSSYNTFALNHTYLLPGNYTVSVAVTDNGGSTGVSTAHVTIVSPNAPPIIQPLSNAFINKGDIYNALDNFTDPDSTSWTATVDYGDGSDSQPLVLSSTNFSLSHVYTTIGTYTVTVSVTDNQGAIGTETATVTVQRQLVALSPAKVWIGLKNSDDVGIKFDLKAEIYEGNALVSSGELDSVAGGSSGFNNAHLYSVPFNSFSAVDFPSGSQLKVEVYVRNACSGSGHNSGTARLWFNDSAANSQFGATLGASANSYFLLDGFVLGNTAGSGPKQTIDMAAGSKCSPFKPFGTWVITL